LSPHPLNSPAAPILSYPAEDTYRPTGRATAIGLILCLAGGLLAAAIAAAGAFAWVVSKLPSWLVLPMVGQGVGVGLVLAWLFRRNKVRSSAAAVVIGIVCGIASATLFHFGLYVRNALVVRDQLRQDWRQLGMDQTPTGRQMLDQIGSHPLQLFDRTVIFPRTRHNGFLGYMMIRGTRVQVMALVQATIVAWLAVALGRQTTAKPFCEDCGAWFKPPVNAAVLPADCGGALAEAIEADDPQRVYAVHRAAGRELGTSCAVARVHACASCGKQYADVVIVASAGASRSQRVVRQLRRVSPETVTALKWEAPDPAPPP